MTRTRHQARRWYPKPRTLIDLWVERGHVENTPRAKRLILRALQNMMGLVWHEPNVPTGHRVTSLPQHYIRQREIRDNILLHGHPDPRD